MKKIFSLNNKIFLKRIGSILIILLSLLPLYRLSSVVFTVGENNLSNDYVAFVRTIIPIMNGDISLSSLGKTCFRGQCEPVTFFAVAFLAKMSQWNVHIEIAFSLLISFITAVLIYFSINPLTLNPRKFWIIIFISAFIFSFTLISTFTFGQASIYSTTSLLGICLGFLGVRKFANTFKGIGLLVLGMVISAWSYGGGLLSIPILFVGLIIGFRTKKVFYWIWGASLFLISIPYIQYFTTNEAASSSIEITSFFRISWIVNLIGSFFSNELSLPYPGKEIFFTSNPFFFGYIGIFFLFLGIVFLLNIYGLKNVHLFFTELGLLVFGLGSGWIVSVIRTGIAPWYVAHILPFWIGLICLFFSLVNNGAFIQRTIPRLVKLSTIALFSIVTVLYLHSNVEYKDKVLHLLSRAPTSVSCLRNYQIAPTYCEPYLFQWEPGNPVSIHSLGYPLDMNNLSVFAPGQEWSLQGDFVLNAVRTYPASSGKNPYWIDNEGNISPWSDYHRLSLALPTTSTIKWDLDIPETLEHGKFITFAKLDPVGDGETYHDEIVLEVTISTLDNGAKSVHSFMLSNEVNADAWLPIELSVTEYTGRRISISITSNSSFKGNAVVTILKYPMIRAELRDTGIEPANQYFPENIVDLTDKTILFQFLRENSTRLINKHQISFSNLMFDQAANSLSSLKGKSGNISLFNKGDFCVSSDSQFYMRITAEKEEGAVKNNYYSVIVFNYITTEGEFSSSQIILPHLGDGQTHTYSYPLKLLESPSYITGIEITPVANNEEIGYEIRDIGFYGNDVFPDKCYKSPMLDIPPKEPAGEIVEKFTVSQTFVTECDGLSQVQLLFGTYMKKNSYPIVVKISEVNNGLNNLIFKETIPPNTLDDNSWYSVNFPKVEVSKDLNFRIDISSPNSVHGDAVTVWQSDADVYPLGSVYINEVPIEKDISFRYICEP